MTLETALKYMQHGDEEIQLMAKGYVELWQAATNLLMLATWIADRHVPEQDLWEDLQSACGVQTQLLDPSPFFQQIVDFRAQIMAETLKTEDELDE